MKTPLQIISGGMHAPGKHTQLMQWVPIIVGLVVLYVPSLFDLFRGIWSQDEQLHGPVILGVSVWLLYRNWVPMLEDSQNKPTSSSGWPIFVIGLLLYIVGRSQEIILFEVGSVIWILAGIVLIKHGFSAVKAQWFALFFMLFMIPLPGPLVEAVTMPMKMAVSYVAEILLYSVGYPIARSGVILQIGNYLLLVADACAGLHTLLTLEALGLLYLNLVRRNSLFRNVGLGLMIVPISFTANVIRVISLTLVTYYLGDEAGQGFLHGFAGMVLFMSALLLIIGFDAIIHTFDELRKKPTSV